MLALGSRTTVNLPAVDAVTVAVRQRQAGPR
jgi:hypothetical protein